MKKIVVYLFVLCFSLLFVISFCDKVVKESVKSSNQIELQARVGVVLGTSKYALKSENLFYRNRIQKAYELYRTGRIKFIVVSGDNGTVFYDEPTQMKKDLVELGVPSGKVFCDYAGFSTIDSMLRMKLVFNLKEFVVISQKFHADRAIYLGKRNGLNIIPGYAKDVPEWYAPYNKYREKLARVKAVYDILIGTEPKFKGKRIEIK